MDGGAQYITSLEFAKLLIPRKFQFGKVCPNTTRAIFLSKQIACSQNRLLVLKQLFYSTMLVRLMAINSRATTTCVLGHHDALQHIYFSSSTNSLIRIFIYI